MVERPTTGPLPPVHPDPHGRPPLADGTQAVRELLRHKDTRATQRYADSQPPPSPPPVTFGERLTAVICVCIVLAAIAIGSLR